MGTEKLKMKMRFLVLKMNKCEGEKKMEMKNKAPLLL
jgi:hypothetical protein